MKKFNWGIAEWLIPFLALCVTTDQWTASTGSADPYQLMIAGAPFSIMAAARGISIVLTVTYALYKIRVIRSGQAGTDKILFSVLIGCIILLLATEAFVITPYTMTVMAKSDTGKTLLSINVILFYVWALFVSDAALVAVITAGLASLVIENQPQATKAKSVQVPQPVKEKAIALRSQPVQTEIPKSQPESVALPPLPIRKGVTTK